MLKLLRWEWERNLKKALMLWLPVLIAFYIFERVMQEYVLYHYGPDKVIEVEYMLCLINTAGGRLLLLGLVVVIASFIYMVLLAQEVVSIIGRVQEMGENYLLLTTPEPATKILAAKFLASFPLLLMMAVVSPFFYFGVLSWWEQVLIFYTIIMMTVFAWMLWEAVLAEKWYGVWLFLPGYLSVVAFGTLFILHEIKIFKLTDHSILFLITLSIVFFFTTAYLAEKKLDIWE